MTQDTSLQPPPWGERERWSPSIRELPRAGSLKSFWKTEDYWAVWLGLGIVILALVIYSVGATIKGWAVTPGRWADTSDLGADQRSNDLWTQAILGI